MMCSRCKKRLAVVFMTRLEGDKTINEGLCLTCAKELGIKQVDDLMKNMGITDEDLQHMNEQMEGMTDLMAVENGSESGDDEDEDEAEGFQLGGAQTFPFLQNLFGPGQGANAGESGQEAKKPVNDKNNKKDKKPKRKFLDNYCENLTDKARRGKLDRIIGRDQEIYRVVQILNRRTKNNPCLIGEPGVGKTAIAEGIALRIVSGDVPAKLAEKEIHLLDLTALVAGTQFRGQFESRVKGLVDEVRNAGNIILFIDEVHNLVGAGDSEGSMNAANILKPALSRGEIQVIGATTFNEYRKYIEKDAALERRFQPVTVNEPTIADTVQVLMGIKEYYEGYHHVSVPEEIVRSAVTLSERYINDRFLPDKAIDLLDEACSCAALRNKELAEYEALSKKIAIMRHEETEMEQSTSSEPIDYEKLAGIKAQLLRDEARSQELEPIVLKAAVTPDDLARVIELWTGIPASRIKENELSKLAHLEDALRKKIIGQDEAVDLVAKAVRRSRVQITARRRPASFIFVGPTGVGKTELVKVLASELFDSTDPLIRLDMSEYMEKYSVSRIVGSPPGYVGYDEAGQLTEQVRRKPYSVILFDEIEKAHPDVMNILLQILDEGRVTDSHGRKVSFENTVVVMTSNAGSNSKEASLGFNKTEQQMQKEKAMRALSDFLRPEFMARVDETVVFRALDEGDFSKIAALLLSEMAEVLAERSIKLSYDDAALGVIAHKAFGNKSGARDIRRILRKEVEDRVCTILVEDPTRQIEGIQVTVKDGEDGKQELDVLTL